MSRTCRRQPSRLPSTAFGPATGEHCWCNAARCAALRWDSVSLAHGSNHTPIPPRIFRDCACAATRTGCCRSTSSSDGTTLTCATKVRIPLFSYLFTASATLPDLPHHAQALHRVARVAEAPPLLSVFQRPPSATSTTWVLTASPTTAPSTVLTQP